jgi:hypothetical protein
MMSASPEIMNTPQQLAAQAYSNEIHAIFTSNKRRKAKLLKAAKEMIAEAIRITPVSAEIENMTADELLAELNA